MKNSFKIQIDQINIESEKTNKQTNLWETHPSDICKITSMDEEEVGGCWESRRNGLEKVSLELLHVCG